MTSRPRSSATIDPRGTSTSACGGPSIVSPSRPPVRTGPGRPLASGDLRPRAGPAVAAVSRAVVQPGLPRRGAGSGSRRRHPARPTSRSRPRPCRGAARRSALDPAPRRPGWRSPGWRRSRSRRGRSARRRTAARGRHRRARSASAAAGSSRSGLSLMSTTRTKAAPTAVVSNAGQQGRQDGGAALEDRSRGAGVDEADHAEERHREDRQHRGVGGLGRRHQVLRARPRSGC